MLSNMHSQIKVYWLNCSCTSYSSVDEKKTQDGSDDMFRCPCGECSLDQYLDERCPKSSSQQFPYLDVDSLDKDYREDLNQKLLQDKTDMINSFAELTDKTRKSIDERCIPVQALAARALSLGTYYDAQVMPKPLLGAEIERLQLSETVHKVFMILQPHMSFFNYGLLKHITDCKELCTDDDRERMKEYCTKFDEFCRRKIFEVPPGAVGKSTATTRKSERKAFAVLVTKLEEGTETKHKIASTLKLKSSTLHLHRIDKAMVIKLTVSQTRPTSHI